MELILIGTFSAVVFIFLKFYWKRGEDLYFNAFLFLFIYTIFGQIGYLFFNDISKLIGAYFGEKIYLNYWFFITGSFIFSFALHQLIFKKIQFNYQIVSVVDNKTELRKIFFHFITTALLIYLITFFLLNRHLFKWGGGNSLVSTTYAICYRLYAGILLIQYINLREMRWALWRFVVFILGTIMYLSVAIAVGSRSDLLYLLLAIIVFEFHPLKIILKKKKEMLLGLTIGVSFIFLSNLLLNSRAGGAEVETDKSIAEILLLQDYFTPAHLLFIALEFNFIEPLLVIKSNIANALMGMRVPMLSANLTELLGLRFERGESWAFHLFTEGFIFGGFLGIVYNGIIFNIGMKIWSFYKRFSKVNEQRVILSIVTLMIISAMRNQSSVFIKFFYLNILPTIIFYLFSRNKKIKII